MDKKEWYGSELIFDIDGKDLHLDCALKHNYTKCHACNLINTGVLKKCSNCNGSRLYVIDIPCKNCIFFLKKEVRKLINLLTRRFWNRSIKLYLFIFLEIMDFIYMLLIKIIILYFQLREQKFRVIFWGKGFKLETLGIKLNNEKKYIPY